MEFVKATGGRELYFTKPDVRDCCTRAICNATGMDYLEVYNGINTAAKSERNCKRAKSSARNGVRPATIKKYIEDVLGWVWVPCMGIGTGCQVHVRKDELPEKGTYILNLSGHLSCWKDGKLYDTYDCSRDGTRCVYGYWRAPTAAEKYAHDDILATLAMERAAKEKIRTEKVKQNADIRKKNDKVRKAYAKRINALRSQIRRLERERDSKMIPLVK